MSGAGAPSGDALRGPFYCLRSLLSANPDSGGPASDKDGRTLLALNFSAFLKANTLHSVPVQRKMGNGFVQKPEVASAFGLAKPQCRSSGQGASSLVQKGPGVPAEITKDGRDP